ncbi:MAG TPA: SDR family NAD(P)-dependent oxidoreductase [Microbacteriaceae bacterium]|nr:SDR family NAD(P)-dependent oxidoreductase [Microbacteriaceae bacterium]
MTTRQSLHEEWTVVTGASDGIGRALAVRLAAQSRNLVLIGRSAAKLDALSAELHGFGGERRFLALDLAEPEAIDAIDAATRDLDVAMLIQAAGYGSAGRFDQLDPSTEASMVDVNCRAVVALCAMFAPRLVARGGGALVLFSSILGFQGAGGSATYAATKGFVQSFAEGLRRDLLGTGVSVLAVAPGPTASGFAAAAGMSFSAMATADSVADAIVPNLRKNKNLAPGLAASVMRSGLATAPRSLRVRIITPVMRSFASKEHTQ